MDFRLDEVAADLVTLADETLERELPPERFSSDEFQAAGYSAPAWSALAGAGVLEAFLPEALGGVDADPTALTGVVRTAAAHGSMVPALATLSFGLLPLQRCATDGRFDKLTLAIASGTSLVTAALREPGGRWIRDATTSAVRDGDDYVISGVKSFVLYGAEAAAILVPAVTPSGVEVFCVPGDAEGLLRSPHPVSSHVPTCRLQLDAVRVPATSMLVSDPPAADFLELSARLGIAAAAAGIMEAALTLTANHVKTRRQFGRSLAEFQAVTMQVADAYIASSAIRSVADAASWQIATGRLAQARESLAASAYLVAHDLRGALMNCQHVHGGTAMDLDYPMHRFLTTGIDLADLLGGTDAVLDASAGLAWQH